MYVGNKKYKRFNFPTEKQSDIIVIEYFGNQEGRKLSKHYVGVKSVWKTLMNHLSYNFLVMIICGSWCVISKWSMISCQRCWICWYNWLMWNISGSEWSWMSISCEWSWCCDNLSWWIMCCNWSSYDWWQDFSRCWGNNFCWGSVNCRCWGDDLSWWIDCWGWSDNFSWCGINWSRWENLSRSSCINLSWGINWSWSNNFSRSSMYNLSNRNSSTLCNDSIESINSISGLIKIHSKHSV